MSRAVTVRVGKPDPRGGSEPPRPREGRADTLDDLSEAAQECRLLGQHPWPRPGNRGHRRFIRFEVTQTRGDRVVAGVVHRTCTGGCGRIRSEPVRRNRNGRMVRDGRYTYGQVPGTTFLLAPGATREQPVEEWKEQRGNELLHQMFPDLQW